MEAQTSSSLKEYLKKYVSNPAEEKKNKKKKKKAKPVAVAGGVHVVDEDPVWQKPVNFEEEEENDSPDEKLQVDEDIEFKRIKRLEELRARRSYNEISEDGSGWVPISDVPKGSNSVDPISDISPRNQKARYHTPSPEPGRESSDLLPAQQHRRRYDSPSPECRSIDLDADKDGDMSPPRRKRQSQGSPSPMPQRNPLVSGLRDSDLGDLSPPRRERLSSPKLNDSQVSEDLSPPRKGQKGIDNRGRRGNSAHERSTEVDLSPPRKRKEQQKTGLITGKDVSNEIAKTKKDEWSRFNQMDPSTSGRGAEPIYRFKGERVSKDEYLKLTKKKEEKPKHTIKIAVESLKRCLSQSEIEEKADHHSNHLIDKFQSVLKQQLQSANEQDSYDSNDSTATGEGHFDPLAKKFSKLVDNLNNSWIALQPESNPSLSSPSQLPEHLHRYLICFTLLGDDDALMTRGQLIYWWVGLGLKGFEDGQGVEDAADDILKKLTESGAIEEVSNKKKQRSATKYRRIMKLSNQFMEEQNVGILKKEGANLKLIKYPNGTAIDKDNSKALIETTIMFNLAVSILNIRRDWLQKMRSLKVLYLGNWSSDKKHVEFETMEFLQALKQLKKVRYISLKGIAGIMKLADEICSLGESLRVLDLRDCSNLEMLPKGIRRLKNLTHLDLSECFLLDHIPKEIVSLTKLQVLKGFVITDVETTSSCKFKDLASHLGKTLIKLTFRTRMVSFPNEDDLKAFSQFKELLKLKVVWVRIFHFDHENELQQVDIFNPEESQQKDTIKPREALRIQSLKIGKMKSFRTKEENLSIVLPKKLQKLEVHDIPQAAVKSLLLGNKDNELELKKLYIIGGEVSDLIGQGEVKWKNDIETLRLKYLSKLHMSWMQFKVSFPNVTHLEMVHCPYLTFFPCDPNGIWTK